MEDLEYKPIVGFEELYKISNYGDISALPRSWVVNNSQRSHNGLIIRPGKTTGGYHQCILSKDAQQKRFAVHRLVALHFVKNPDPEHFDQVNHLDGNKLNNYFKNLEWCDRSRNILHAFATGLCKPISIKGRINEQNSRSKPLYQLTQSGVIVKEWPSLKEIYRQLGYYPSSISNACLGKQASAHGFRWQYK